MKDFTQKKLKTLYPNSIIAKTKLLYRKTNKELNIFLNENFSHNPSLIHKFPIKSINIRNKKIPLKRKNAISSKNINKINNIPEKSSIRKLIDSLRSDHYISYNYYDNTKGNLGSAKARVDRTLKYSLASKSFNDSNNNNRLSIDSKSKTFKFKLFRRNYSLKNRNNYQSGFFSQKDLSSDFNSFSMSNCLSSKRETNSKNTNIPQTPSSTRYKSKSKRNSINIHNSLSINNSQSRNRRIRSSFSIRKNKNKKVNIKIDLDYLMNRKLNLSDANFIREQRKFHQKLYLQNLKSQVRDFEKSNAFYFDDEQIKSNLISLDKFQRDTFVKKIKNAAKVNDFFYKKFPNQLKKYENIHIKKKIKKRPNLPHLNMCSDEAKVVLKNVEKLQKRYNASTNYIKNLNLKLRTNYLKRLIDFVIPFEDKKRDIDKQFKGETLNYQKDIGKFFIYKGFGVYAGHLSTILRGDKIVKQEIKFDDNNFN